MACSPEQGLVLVQTRDFLAAENIWVHWHSSHALVAQRHQTERTRKLNEKERKLTQWYCFWNIKIQLKHYLYAYWLLYLIIKITHLYHDIKSWLTLELSSSVTGWCISTLILGPSVATTSMGASVAVSGGEWILFVSNDGGVGNIRASSDAAGNHSELLRGIRYHITKTKQNKNQ